MLISLISMGIQDEARCVGGVDMVMMMFGSIRYHHPDFMGVRYELDDEADDDDDIKGE